MFENPQTRQEKKSLSDELFLDVFFESSESDRFFNYVNDSNSIFRTGRILSEGVFGRTERESGRVNEALDRKSVCQKWCDVFDTHMAESVVSVRGPRLEFGSSSACTDMEDPHVSIVLGITSALVQGA